MKIEEEILEGYLLKEETLKDYGFVFVKDRYIKKYPVFNGDFCAEVSIFKGKVVARMIDTAFGDEYVLFNNESSSGEFVGRLREEYQKILIDIRQHCYRKAVFPDFQAERVAKYIEKTYGDKPDFPWEKYPYYGVYRRKDNNRWYGLVMEVEKGKLSKEASKRWVINIKPHPAMFNELLKVDNIYPGWHMNKKTWLSISLSDYFPDEYVFSLIDMSYEEVNGLSKVRVFPPVSKKSKKE